MYRRIHVQSIYSMLQFGGQKPLNQKITINDVLTNCNRAKSIREITYRILWSQTNNFLLIIVLFLFLNFSWLLSWNAPLQKMFSATRIQETRKLQAQWHKQQCKFSSKRQFSVKVFKSLFILSITNSFPFQYYSKLLLYLT